MNRSADFQIGPSRADLEVGAPVRSVLGFNAQIWVGGNLSLMPQELEKTMTAQELADLLAYLKGEQ